MNLMFWKKKVASSGEEAGGGDVKDDAPAKDEMPDLDQEMLEEAARLKSARFKKRLLIYSALGLVILLLLGLIFAAWKLLFSAKPQEVAAPVAVNAPPIPVNGPIIILPPGQGKRNLIKLPGIEGRQEAAQETANPQQVAVPDELEALRKKNEELEAQLNALKQEGQQPALSSPVQRGVSPARSGGGGGEVMLGSQDPKATAMTLKAAIEAMNAGTGGYTKKPPVKQQAKEPVKPATP